MGMYEHSAPDTRRWRVVNVVAYHPDAVPRLGASPEAFPRPLAGFRERKAKV